MRAEFITKPEDMQFIRGFMESDGHTPLNPTHMLITAEDSVCGAFSTHYRPLLLFWVHSSYRSPIASLRAFKLAEKAMKEEGCSNIVLPCEKDSPYHKYVKTLPGYVHFKDCELFIKEL